MNDITLWYIYIGGYIISCLLSAIIYTIFAEEFDMIWNDGTLNGEEIAKYVFLTIAIMFGWMLVIPVLIVIGISVYVKIKHKDKLKKFKSKFKEIK